MDDSWVLLDGRTGLHVRWYFWLRVLDEVNRSARYGTPFGLLLLSCEAGRPKSRRAIEEGLSRVPLAVRNTDLAGLVSPGEAGILLTQQDGESAGLARDRILAFLAEHGARDARWQSRLLTYPVDAAEISRLLTDGGHRPGQASAVLDRPA
jgi:hypothetical protein